jgi:hypothetical protein
VEIYGRVRRAVRVEGRSQRAVAREFWAFAGDGTEDAAVRCAARLRKRSKVPSGGSASPEKSIAAWMQELSELDVGGGGRLRRSFRLCS